ncbi:hypothetical protein Lepto7375DRAFT_5988 [Leptolyngbya sp. PCC 7375]|nr:hypothetical protein Lepto7375DRAFT_5988 [Leptolyngbya sp. PCC 7375]
MNFLKLLFNPIFLLAAGLHAGLLIIPIAGGSSDSVVPAPDPEGESITVTRIPPKAAQTVPGQPGATRPAPRPAAGVATAIRQPASAGQPTTASQQPAQTRQTRNGQTDKTGSTTGRSNSDNRRRASTNNGNNRRGSTSQNPTDNRNTDNEIAVLSPPSNPPNSGGSDGTADNTPAVQEPPTLVALKNGAQAEVPNLLRDFLTRLRHSVLRTTDPETEETKQKWLVNLTEEQGLNVSEAQGLEKAVEISYPLIADEGRRFLSCLTPLPEKGLVGVVVDADGAIATEPALLRSSGYGFLNEIALEKVKDYTDFPEESSQQAYTIDIEVDYDEDACVDLAQLKK